MTPKYRFDGYYRVMDNGCWIWKKCVNKNGYGQIKIEGKSYKAHRVSMHLHRGFDLNSLELVLHKPECNNPSCVNPDHLYIGTPADNMRDYSKTITHCPQGHEYTPENTYREPYGAKYCLSCRRERNAQKRVER